MSVIEALRFIFRERKLNMNNCQNYRWNTMTMGTCYYPEHWDKSLWENDLERMLDAGISVVRIAEFAWSKVERTEGEFNYDFFDEFLDLCQRKGMKVIFGTPSATPPAWLTEKYPEVLNGREDGVLYRHGGRRHYNYNSPKYRELVSRIVTKIASHYGPHPAIVGWQIDNEINCEVSEFYSDADTAAFRVFLQEKYVTLDRLNEAWGTVFWNQTYTEWDQIYVPRTLLNESYNPHLRLDYYRFISESAISFCKMQADIIRKYKKEDDYITTNGIFWNLDNHRMEKECLDVFTYDSYPSFAFGLDRDPLTAADLNDRHWSRNLTEVKDFYKKFKKLDVLCGSEYTAAFGVLKDYDNAWDTNVDVWHRRVAETSEEAVFEAAQLSHTPYNVIYLQNDSTVEDLMPYPVLFYLHPVIMTEEREALLEAYVEQGGTLIIGCRSGYKQENGQCVMMPQPGLLHKLTGTDVRDFTFTSPAEKAVYADWDGQKLDMPLFNDIMDIAEDAQEVKVLAVYASSYYKGKIALTEKRTGKGRTLHLGSAFSRSNVKTLLVYTGVLEPFAEIIEATEGVELIQRTKNRRKYLFVLNFQPDEQRLLLKKEMKRLFKGGTAMGEVKLAAFEVEVFELIQ